MTAPRHGSPEETLGIADTHIITKSICTYRRELEFFHNLHKYGYKQQVFRNGNPQNFRKTGHFSYNYQSVNDLTQAKDMNNFSIISIMSSLFSSLEQQERGIILLLNNTHKRLRQNDHFDTAPTESCGKN